MEWVTVLVTKLVAFALAIVFAGGFLAGMYFVETFGR